MKLLDACSFGKTGLSLWYHSFIFNPQLIHLDSSHISQVKAFLVRLRPLVEDSEKLKQMIGQFGDMHSIFFADSLNCALVTAGWFINYRNEDIAKLRYYWEYLYQNMDLAYIEKNRGHCYYDRKPAAQHKDLDRAYEPFSKMLGRVGSNYISYYHHLRVLSEDLARIVLNPNRGF